MTKKIRFLSTFLSVIMLILSGCMSSTMIETQPKGAKVFLDNEYVGTSPVVMQDYKFATMSTYVRIEKDGYETIYTDICRDEEIDIGSAIAGFFFYYPWVWIFKYQPVHSYIMKPIEMSNNNDSETTQDEDLDYYYEQDNPNTNVSNNTNLNNSVQEVSPKTKKLKELKQLFDEGILSQKEYETEKEKILKEDEW